MPQFEYVVVEAPGPNGPRVHVEPTPVIGVWPDGENRVEWAPTEPGHVPRTSFSLGADGEFADKTAEILGRVVNLIDLAEGLPELLRRHDHAGTAAVAEFCQGAVDTEVACSIWRRVDNDRAVSGQ